MKQPSLSSIASLFFAHLCLCNAATTSTDNANRVEQIVYSNSEVLFSYDLTGNLLEARGNNPIGIEISAPISLGGNQYETEETLTHSSQTPDSLTLYATSSNPSIVPFDSLILSGSGEARSLTFSKTSASIGSTRLQLVATDGDVSNQNSIIVEATSASVIGAHLFYNNSFFDGNNPAANIADDNAIATDKEPLLPGGRATFSNYSSYFRGINGIILDVSEVPTTSLSASDFLLKVGNDNTVAGWQTAPEPVSITIREDAGVGGSDRVTLIWEDNKIMKSWLSLTLLGNANTGLREAYICYFGNAVGDTGNDLENAQVTVSDENGARQNPRNFQNPAPVEFDFDFNRDARVNISDENIARQNSTNFLTALRLLDLSDSSLKDVNRLSLRLVDNKTSSHEPYDSLSQLTIRRTHNENILLVSFSCKTDRGLTLQVCSSLAGNQNWKTLSNRVDVAEDKRGFHYQWRVRAASARQFFRLRYNSQATRD